MKHRREGWEHRTLRVFLTEGSPQGSACCLWGAVVTSGQVTRKLGLSVLTATADLKDEFFLESPVELLSDLAFGWPEHGSLPIPADHVPYRTGHGFKSSSLWQLVTQQ